MSDIRESHFSSASQFHLPRAADTKTSSTGETKSGPRTTYHSVNESQQAEPAPALLDRDVRDACSEGAPALATFERLLIRLKSWDREPLTPVRRCTLMRDYCRLAGDPEHAGDARLYTIRAHMLARVCLVQPDSSHAAKGFYVGLGELAAMLAREGGLQAGAEAVQLAAAALRGGYGDAGIADVIVGAFSRRLVTEAHRDCHTKSVLDALWFSEFDFTCISADTARALMDAVVAELPALDAESMTTLLAFACRSATKSAPASEVQALLAGFYRVFPQVATALSPESLHGLIYALLPIDPLLPQRLVAIDGWGPAQRLQIASSLSCRMASYAGPVEDLPRAILDIAVQAGSGQAEMILAAVSHAPDASVMPARLTHLARATPAGRSIDLRRVAELAGSPLRALDRASERETALPFIERMFRPTQADPETSSEEQSSIIERLALLTFPNGHGRLKEKLIFAACPDALNPQRPQLHLLTGSARLILHRVMLDAALARRDVAGSPADGPIRLDDVDVGHLLAGYGALSVIAATAAVQDRELAYEALAGCHLHLKAREQLGGGAMVRRLREHMDLLLDNTVGRWLPRLASENELAVARIRIALWSDDDSWLREVARAAGKQNHPLLEAIVRQMGRSPDPMARKEEFLSVLDPLGDAAVRAALGALLGHEASGAVVKAGDIARLMESEAMPERAKPWLATCQTLLASLAAQPGRPEMEVLAELARAVLADGAIAPADRQVRLQAVAWAAQVCQVLPWSHPQEDWVQAMLQESQWTRIDGKSEARSIDGILDELESKPDALLRQLPPPGWREALQAEPDRVLQRIAARAAAWDVQHAPAHAQVFGEFTGRGLGGLLMPAQAAATTVRTLGANPGFNPGVLRQFVLGLCHAAGAERMGHDIREALAGAARSLSPARAEAVNRALAAVPTKAPPPSRPHGLG